MNNGLRFATVLVTIATATGIAACATTGTSSAPPTAASASTPFGKLESPAGEKKIGPYVWVWRTAKLYKETTIEADCPVNYAVMGGGFRGSISDVHESFPNAALTGWVVSAYGGGRGIVYAGCVPVK
jgi:hypothetical protein